MLNRKTKQDLYFKNLNRCRAGRKDHGGATVDADPETAEDTPDSMPHSLYSDDSSMEALGSYDHADSEGFLKVLGVSAKQFGAKQFPKLGR